MKINKEGYQILIYTLSGVVLLTMALYFLIPLAGMPVWLFWTLAGVLIALLILVAMFFREPSREHITDRDMVFSGADGKVVVVERVDESEFLGEPRIQVSVFMSLANVHVNWFPVSGKVVYRKDHPGSYMVAWHPKSSEENERTTTVIDTGRNLILFRQIAGMVARRIVNYAEEGKNVEQNTKCGFIKFGSRIDIFLPLDSEVLVSLGDKVRGGQTPIARLKR